MAEMKKLSRLEGSGPSNLPMGVRVLVYPELLGALFCLTELLGQNGKAVGGRAGGSAVLA